MVVELRRSLIVVVMSVIAFGLIYPTVMLLISQAAFSSQADGSLISDDGQHGWLVADRPELHQAAVLPGTAVGHQPRL